MRTLLPTALLLVACSTPRLTTPVGRVEAEINGGSDHGIEMNGAVYGQGRLWLSIRRTGLWSLDLESGQLVAWEESTGNRQAAFRLPLRTPTGQPSTVFSSPAERVPIEPSRGARPPQPLLSRRIARRAAWRSRRSLVVAARFSDEIARRSPSRPRARAATSG
jgi:hypothetical protein